MEGGGILRRRTLEFQFRRMTLNKTGQSPTERHQEEWEMVVRNWKGVVR
jgi:hypothetical protein